MDIKEISVSRGQNLNFMDQVHESMVEKCKRYVQRSGGPTNIFKNLDGRTPIQFAQDAFRPLAKYADKIAVVIDGSTTRGFAYPAQSSLYAQEFGLKPEQCFDMVEACNGMARALETAYMMYLTKPELNDKYIMIINNEMPPDTRGVLPQDITKYAQVASYYVGLTFSHVCTITILEKSQNHTWNFSRYTKTSYASNINIPLPKIAKGYTPECKHFDIELNEQYGQFCIPNFHDSENKAIWLLSNYFSNQDFFKNECNVICHTFSKSVYEKFLGFTEMHKISVYYNETGNLGSCSLPFILHDQYGPTGIPEHQKLAFIGNAAGGSNILVTWKHRDQTSAPEFQLVKEIKIKPLLFLKMRVAWRQKFMNALGFYKKPNFVGCENWDQPQYDIKNVKLQQQQKEEKQRQYEENQNVKEFEKEMAKFQAENIELDDKDEFNYYSSTDDSFCKSMNSSVSSQQPKNNLYNDYQKSIYFLD